jgi:hypothetical protein
MSVRTKLAIGTTASFVLLTAGSCGDAGGRSPSAGDSSPSASDVGEGPQAAQAGTEMACVHVEARPTYLPWLDEGEEVPEPQREVDNGTSYVMWTSGDGGPSQKSVIFRRSSEPRGGLGEPVSVRLEGAQGYYYTAPGSSGGVLWKTGSEPCGLITLAVSLPGSSQAEIRDEVLKIVESLET